MRSGVNIDFRLGSCMPSAAMGFRIARLSSVTRRHSLFALSLFIALRMERKVSNETV